MFFVKKLIGKDILTYFIVIKKSSMLQASLVSC